MKRTMVLLGLVLVLMALSASISSAKSPIRTEDSCACGGTVWFTFDGGYYDSGAGYTMCFYTQHPNGQHIRQIWNGVYTCPSQPQF